MILVTIHEVILFRRTIAGYLSRELLPGLDPEYMDLSKHFAPFPLQIIDV